MMLDTPMHGEQEELRSTDLIGERRRKRGGKQQKYFLSDEGRELILHHYDSQPQTIEWLVTQISTPEQPVPRCQVRKWARELGVARLKELPWSEQEVAYLRNCSRRHGLKKIAKELGRTEISVKLKARRLGIRKLVTGDGHTMRSICRGLGVDHHQVERWLQEGWFWGERRESRRHDKQRGDIWYFEDEAIRTLVRQHPEEINLRRLNWPWFVTVMLGRIFLGVEEDFPDMHPPDALSCLLLQVHYRPEKTEALATLLDVSPTVITLWASCLGIRWSGSSEARDETGERSEDEREEP